MDDKTLSMKCSQSKEKLEKGCSVRYLRKTGVVHVRFDKWDADLQSYENIVRYMKGVGCFFGVYLRVLSQRLIFEHENTV